jgi:hypothetical protein
MARSNGRRQLACRPAKFQAEHARRLKARKASRQTLRHDNDADRTFIISGPIGKRGGGLGLCGIEWMTRLSFDVPAVISRCRQKNAPRLRSTSWIFATCVPGAAWKRSAPLQKKRPERVRLPPVAFRPGSPAADYERPGDAPPPTN